MSQLDVAATFRGKHLLMTGVTGFVGKAFLAWMMCHHPDVRKITCIVRPKSRQKPKDRLAGVLRAEALQIVHERFGAALDGWVAEKLDAVTGDLAKPLIGLSEEDIERLKGDVDVLINVAASVDFTPPLNDAITTNAEGAIGAVELARRLGVPFAHVSTCFVAGYTSGFVPEEIAASCPNADIEKFDPEKELVLAQRLIARILEDRDDPTLPPPRRRLRTEGEARSRALGWPNTYTYTKSLAERLIQKRAGDVPYTIVRPAIVESAWKFPLPGWSEGGNGSAGCILMASLGQRWTPSKPDIVLDLVPVDLVAKGLALAVAALMTGQHERVYQLGTSYLNPLQMHRITELVNVWRHAKAEQPGTTVAERLWLTSTDAVPNGKAGYQRFSAPALRKAAGALSGWLDKAPLPPDTRLSKAVGRAKAMADAVERTARGVEAVYDVYAPFISDVDVIFKTRNIRALVERLSPEEQALYAYDADGFDWFDYFQEVHLPGLEKWIYPEMLRKLKQGITPDEPNPAPIPGDLLDLLERSVATHGSRPFLGRTGEGRPQTLTYTEVHERARVVAQRLIAAGVVPGDRVMLLVDRGPEWALAFFGALYAGATAVPVDPTTPADTIGRLASRSSARVIVASKARLGALGGATVPTLEAEQITRVDREEHAPKALPELPRHAERPASILFTSGTTGTPRGVVLTHANFLAVLRGIHGVYDLGAHDRFLSLLPLHHSFEFTAGLLFPLSKGASVVYPVKISAEGLPDLLNEVRPTAMVGVPALWTALARKVGQRIDDLPAPVRRVLDELARLNGEMRDQTGINLGGWLFIPIHAGLGGELRHLVSGGAALPESVLRDFYRWGFELTSGYGLTEAAPVLTVAPPGTRRGDTVGPPITGVDVKIFEPGPDGVGEIIARGPNVMAGYLDDPDGTKSVVKGGWLHTGDLGRLDDDGHLVIVGRAKEVIVSASGENVYPDELEDRLQHVAGIHELAVVALPDGQGGEKVACVVVPAAGVSESDLRKEIAAQVASLPPAWRPTDLRFRSEALPRTATLKVSRSRLRQEILEAPQAAPAAALEDTTVPADGRWLVDAIARFAGKPAGEVHLGTRLGDEVSLDSLGLLDLVTLIERRTGSSPPAEELAAMATVAEVVEAVLGRSTRKIAPKVPLFFGPDGRPAEASRSVGFTSRLPEGLRESASAFTRRMHGAVTGTILDIEVSGQAYVPEDRPVLVVSNHSSHVDSGILRHALGKMGDDLPLLAAQDYFFGTPWKDLFFGDLLDLVPADRHGSGLAGVRQALRILESGRSLAIFPEGTRSRDGDLQDFRPGAVLIALQAHVDILPVHIEGSHDVLPAGGAMPRSREVRVRIGRPIAHAILESKVRVEGASMQHAADLLRDSLVSLARGGDTLEPWTRSLGVVGGTT